MRETPQAAEGDSIGLCFWPLTAHIVTQGSLDHLAGKWLFKRTLGYIFVLRPVFQQNTTPMCQKDTISYETKLLVDKAFVPALHLLKSTIKSILSHNLLNMSTMFIKELD